MKLNPRFNCSGEHSALQAGEGAYFSCWICDEDIHENNVIAAPSGKPICLACSMDIEERVHEKRNEALSELVAIALLRDINPH